MNLLQELILLEKELPPEEQETEVPSEDNTQEVVSPEEPGDDELLDDVDEEPEDTPEDEVDETPEEDVGSIAEDEGFEKSTDKRFAFGKSRDVTLLTKNEQLDGFDLTFQYMINPKTGAWVFSACFKGQSASDLVEFGSGEDPESLMKHLKRKNKITAHQAVTYLRPPADAEE